jgi:hypothetical protein
LDLAADPGSQHDQSRWKLLKWIMQSPLLSLSQLSLNPRANRAPPW